MFQTKLEKDILYISDNGKPSIVVFRDVFHRLDISEITCVYDYRNVDYPPVVVYELNGKKFELIHDYLFGTHLFGDRETLLEVEKILLSQKKTPCYIERSKTVKTTIREDLLYVDDPQKDDVEILLYVYDILSNSDAKFTKWIEDFDYSPHIFYELNGKEFRLTYDTIFDTRLIGDKETLLEVENIILFKK